ncbi:hypothetical protein LO772_08330 [Yinghuangia sp. ASG 101]|uniref:hypothetical protein n=1 Tax=Yinghuangia sp. ASG 101 TaxID=2896848 RepID=UPI001E506111|nr:hypothetical protein [Yinghuangia sp. ASG 101]UGQ13597.1 hypothetical protein LO772_08330 [Yinghuangia sp. ASG 101]
MITVRLSYATHASAVLDDATAAPPRALASAQPRVFGDLAKPADAAHAAAYLDRPFPSVRPPRRFTGRTVIDAALGRTPTTAAPCTAPGPIAVLHLAPGPDTAGFSDQGWAYLNLGLLRDLGADRWPRTHPWLLVRTGDAVRLITNTDLPDRDLDNPHAVTATARRYLARAYPHR